MKTHILTNKKASTVMQICTELYTDKGSSYVYSFCNKAKLRYHYCNQCEVKTPTIEAPNYFNCAICGQGKNNTKKYNTQRNVGKARYVINYHDGVKKHSDGSDFYDIHTTGNKVCFNAFIQYLQNIGYTEQ